MKIQEIIKIKELERYLKDNFGVCKDYSYGCIACQNQVVFQTIKRFIEFCEDLEKDEKY